VAQARKAGLLPHEHFSVDGTLIETWASIKSFRPKESRMSYLGHALMKNRNGLIVDGVVT